MSTSASDEISRLRRLEGQVLGIAESVPHMQEELERLRARTTELTRGLSSEREGRVNLYDFLELKGAVGRLQAEMRNLQARRVDISSTFSRANKISRTPRYQCVLVTAALCRTISSCSKHGLRHMQQGKYL